MCNILQLTFSNINHLSLHKTIAKRFTAQGGGVPSAISWPYWQVSVCGSMTSNV